MPNSPWHFPYNIELLDLSLLPGQRNLTQKQGIPAGVLQKIERALVLLEHLEGPVV